MRLPDRILIPWILNPDSNGRKSVVKTSKRSKAPIVRPLFDGLFFLRKKMFLCCIPLLLQRSSLQNFTTWKREFKISTDSYIRADGSTSKSRLTFPYFTF